MVEYIYSEASKKYCNCSEGAQEYLINQKDIYDQKRKSNNTKE